MTSTYSKPHNLAEVATRPVHWGQQADHGDHAQNHNSSQYPRSWHPSSLLEPPLDADEVATITSKKERC